MRSSTFQSLASSFLLLAVGAAVSLSAQTAQQTPSQAVPPTGIVAAAPAAKPAATSQPPAKPSDSVVPAPTRAEMLRGAYGPYRANNDLLYYHLDIRVDPEKQLVSGKNTIRFRMLKDGTRIQLDLRETLQIDKILYGTTPLKYERDLCRFSADTARRPSLLH
jgi:hypothetical protein